MSGATGSQSLYSSGARMLTALLITSLMAPGALDLALEPLRLEPISVGSSLPRLSAAEIRVRMQELPDWTTDGESLLYTGTFDDFMDAIAFVNSLVEPAERLGHHPDITINYNQVSLELTTHDAQGLTELDFQLAKIISQLNHP